MDMGFKINENYRILPKVGNDEMVKDNVLQCLEKVENDSPYQLDNRVT